MTKPSASKNSTVPSSSPAPVCAERYQQCGGRKGTNGVITHVAAAKVMKFDRLETCNYAQALLGRFKQVNGSAATKAARAGRASAHAARTSPMSPGARCPARRSTSTTLSAAPESGNGLSKTVKHETRYYWPKGFFQNGKTKHEAVKTNTTTTILMCGPKRGKNETVKTNTTTAIYICIYVSLSLDLSIYMCMYVCIYIYIYMYIYIYIYVYTYSERERERKRHSNMYIKVLITTRRPSEGTTRCAYVGINYNTTIILCICHIYIYIYTHTHIAHTYMYLHLA